METKVESAQVFIRKRLVGELSRITEAERVRYVFQYDDAYFALPDDQARPVSITLPKTQQVYESEILFPFFWGMVSEGLYRDIQLQELKIDPNDPFLLLIKTARYNTITGVTFKEIKPKKNKKTNA